MNEHETSSPKATVNLLSFGYPYGFSVSSCNGMQQLKTITNSRELPQPVSPATIAGPHPATRAHENVLWQMMVSYLTLQTPRVTPDPLRVPMMLAPVVLVLPQVLNYPVKRVLAEMDISVGGNLLIDRLNCHFLKSVFVPTWAIA